MKKWLIISLSLNILFVLFFIGKRIYYSGSILPKKEIKYADVYNYDRADLYSQLPIDTTDIIFVGNSITERFPLTELFHSFKYKNRGIGSNETYHVLGRIGDIAKHRPKSIFLEIGVNDIKKISVDSIMTNYNKIIEIIKNTSPKTEIFIQLLSPVCKGESRLNPGIRKLNDRLNSYALQEHLQTLDLYAPFSKDGLLDSSLTNDGIHFNMKGFKIWKSKI